MKIGLVCPYDLGRPGGVQAQVLDLAQLLAAEGESVVIIGPGAGVTPVATRGRGSNDQGSVKLVDMGRSRLIPGNGSVAPIALGRNVARLMRKSAAEVDVLHVHEPLMPRVGPAALRSGRPVVATFHARPPRWLMPMYQLSPKGWFRKAVLTAVSSEAARAPIKLGPVSVIPNGIDATRYRSEAPKLAKRVVFIGRDEPRKGLSVLTNAWPQVLAAHPDATLVVLGVDGPSEDTTAPKVEYRGRVSEPEKGRLLGEASVLVAPNLGGESFGLILIEGMASRCAVVASDIPAFRAVAGTAAKLVRPGSPSELAQTVISVLDDPVGAEAMSRLGLERARQFDWSQILPRYRACYEEAVGTFSRRG